jgi:sulfite reductase alpha subunit-like flavoprotein
MNKTEINQHIKRRTQRDTALTNNWLKNRGLTEADLLNSQTLLLQAQKTANELLMHHTALFKQQKHEWLKDFAHRSKHKAKRQRITDNECYAVLNYAKSIKRQVFQQHRQFGC